MCGPRKTRQSVWKGTNSYRRNTVTLEGVGDLNKKDGRWYKRLQGIVHHCRFRLKSNLWPETGLSEVALFAMINSAFPSEDP